MKPENPRVGIGVIVENHNGEVLIGKRSGSHAPMYSIPSGSLELGETFEHAAIREVKEETDLDIVEPKVIAVTNNLETFEAEGMHFISIILHTRNFKGLPRIMEPAKCKELFWSKPLEAPEPHFDASKLAIACFVSNVAYKGISE